MAIIKSSIDTIQERFKKRKKRRIKNLEILSENNPKEILKLDTKRRIKKRKSLLDKDVTLEAIVTGNELLPVNYFDRGKRVSESVCRIEVKNDQGRTVKYGTGFMISPNLLITNNHVLKNNQLCEKSIAQFNYEDDADFFPKQDIFFSLDPNRFFYTSVSLDFTLVAINSKNIAGETELHRFGFLKLRDGSGKGLIGEYVSIIHHPNKEKKQISIRENRIVDVIDNFIHHKADAMGGSSGAPIFNDNWDVIAIHHGGIPKKDEDGNLISLDGSKWDTWMGDDRLQYEYNEGIRISKIIYHLKKNKEKIPVRSKRLLDDLLKLTTSE